MERTVVPIGAHRLDLQRGLLLKDGQPVHLRARSFALLVHLARNRGVVLSKDALIAAVWPGLTVTDDSLTQAVKDLRRVLGEADGQAIRTVARRGYVLDAGVEDAAPRARAPRVVVLPFRAEEAAGADPALLDGLAEELTHGLSRYGVLDVVARHSAFRFRPQSVAEAAEAAGRLGADYFVEGHARRLSGRLVLALGLVARGTDRQVWGESLETGPGMLGEVQGAVPHRIVTRLVLDVERRIGLRGATSVPATLDAFGHFTAAVALLRDYGPGVNEAGRDHLDRALALDPDFALAHAYRALAEVMVKGYRDSADEPFGEALRQVELALRLAPEEARCHWVAGMVRLFRREFGAAEIALERARALNPGDPDMAMVLAYVLAVRGRPEEGLPLAERAIAANPLHPNWYHNDMGLILLLAGRHREAIAHTQLWSSPGPSRLVRLAASHAALGELREAAACLDAAGRVGAGKSPAALLEDLTDLERDEDRARLRGLVEAAAGVDRRPEG